MENKKEKTAPDVSVGADTEQPIRKNTTSSISENGGNIKSFEELQREMQLRSDPSYLQTISMNELFDTQYRSKQPLIDGLLYPGTYIFAGSPKLGKSFLMAQLAYHVSTGTPLWNYTTRKGTVLYLALEDDYRRLQERLYRGQKVPIIFTSLFLPASLEMDWMNSLQDLWQSIRTRS